jgi:acetylornithine deacetylase/succinyl-diaminopimelate desuccinylase-like protein
MTVSIDELRERVNALMPRAHDDLAELVACKSVADPRQFPASECVKAARVVIDRFTEAGLRDARLEETPDGHPAVYGHIPAPDGARRSCCAATTTCSRR